MSDKKQLKNRFNLKQEIKDLISIIRKLDKKVVIIFISVAILQTIAWYFTSRRFFRANFFDDLTGAGDVYLLEYLYWFVGDFITLFILPVIIILFLLKDKLRNYGLQFGDYKAGLKLFFIFMIVMLPIIWIASASPEFGAKYPHLQSARDSLDILLIYEIGMLVYMFAWEFIWRGFMLFGLEEKFGFYTVLIQMIPFVILHNGKPSPETFGAILGGIALGILSLRTRSFYYGVLTHISVMYSIDILCTLRYHTNEYGIGFSSIFNIIEKSF